MDAIQIATPLVKGNESFRSLLYDDRNDQLIVPGSHVLGNPTIGWGFALNKQGLSGREADYLLQNRLAVAYAAAQHAVGSVIWSMLDPVRQAALVDMAYTMGGEGLYGFHQMIAALAQRDYAGAAAQALNSAWAKTEAPHRAQRDAGVLRTGTLT